MAEPPDSPPPIRLAPITVAELMEELRWPRLLRAPVLALRPARIGMALVTLLLIGLLGEVATLWRAGPDLGQLFAEMLATRLRSLGAGVADLDLARTIDAGRALLIDLPGELWFRDPLGVLLVLPLMLGAWAIAGGAIARTAATEFAQRVFIPWPRALAFSLSRWAAMLMSLILPIAFIVLLVLIIAVAGGALLSLPVVSLIGAVLFPVLLAIGLIAVLTLLGFALGQWMLLPAVACEGTDAIDAIQRVYHYVLHRAIHLAVYLAILAGLGWVLLALAGMVLGAMDDLVATAIGWISTDHATRVLDDADGLSGADAGAAGLISLWRSLPGLVLAAIGVSYIHSAGAVLYLLIREINDHQETAEIWMPGMIDGTQAEAASGAPIEVRVG